MSKIKMYNDVQQCKEHDGFSIFGDAASCSNSTTVEQTGSNRLHFRRDQTGQGRSARQALVAVSRDLCFERVECLQAVAVSTTNKWNTLETHVLHSSNAW